MTRIDSYTSEEDQYLESNHSTKTQKQLAEEIGRTPDSVKARLKQLNLYKLQPQYFNQKGIHRNGYKYILHSDWSTKQDTPCPLLRPCSRCNELLPIIDFNIDNISGAQDIHGIGRSRFCSECKTKNYMEIDPRRRMIYGARQRSKRDGRECTLKPEDIKILQNCPVLGIELESSSIDNRKTSAELDNSHSLDRVNNLKGYTRDNVMVMSNKANKLKRDGDIDSILPVMTFLLNAEVGKPTYGDKFVPCSEWSKEEIMRLLNEYEALESNKNREV
jgi:hypothetical protein